MSATLIRALAAGKPVIISDIPEWAMLPDSACLRLQHSANDVDSLKEHLWRLLVEPELRQSLSRNAHRYVQENATLDIMGSQYARVIAQVTHDRTASVPIPQRGPSSPTTSAIHPARSISDGTLLGLPVEQVSLREINELLRDWHQLQKASTSNPIIKRTPRFVEFLLNVLRRVRYLGAAWQLQGLLYEAMLQRHEMLNRKVDDLTGQTEALKAELEHLRQQANSDHTPDSR
jgi:hypothetical protein